MVDPALPTVGSLTPVGLTSSAREEAREIIPNRAACMQHDVHIHHHQLDVCHSIVGRKTLLKKRTGCNDPAESEQQTAYGLLPTV